MAEKHALIHDQAMYPPADTKDMSKNLMSGDFERQYSGVKVKKCNRWRQISVVVIGVTAIALVVCLLVLCMVRETQLKRLRHEVDELTASVIAMSATVKSINQKIYNNKHLFTEYKEDTIYADEDQDITNLADSSKKKPQYDASLEKLGGLTVLEDDNMGDDEDPLEMEADEEESGDWYPDYDNRAEKIGISNMVHLKPEDFTDSVVSKQALLSNIREIRRLLNENPENPDLPALVPSATEATRAAKDSRPKRSVFPDSPADAVDEFAAPRLMTKPEERRTPKKFDSSLEHPSKTALHTVTRTVRDSDNGNQRSPFIAAHFHGNTSHLNTEIHEHYKGNGLVRVSHGAAHDVWYPAPWTSASPHPRPTLTKNGHVHVHHTGVYLVYAQIYYLDSHDVISWVLHRTNPESEGRDTLLQCAQSAHSTERLDKPNSCFSASALFLKAGDRLAVRNTGGDRHSLMQPEKSFIGLVKLADAEDPEQEL